MTDGQVLKVGDADFRNVVLESSEPVFVDFGAPWCAPCKAIEPAVAQIAAEYKGKAKVAQVNVDEAPQTAERYGIRSMPTILVFRQGQVVAQFVGAARKAKLEETLQIAFR